MSTHHFAHSWSQWVKKPAHCTLLHLGIELWISWLRVEHGSSVYYNTQAGHNSQIKDSTHLLLGVDVRRLHLCELHLENEFLCSATQHVSDCICIWPINMVVCCLDVVIDKGTCIYVYNFPFQCTNMICIYFSL